MAQDNSRRRNILARIFRWLGLQPAKQMALLQLHARLTRRQFSGEPGRLVGMVVSALIFVPVVLLVGAGSYMGYVRLPEPLPGELLGVVLTLLWLVWLAMPLMAFSINESLDLTRLLVYPLRVGELISAALLGTLFQLPLYLMLPFFAAVVAGWYGLGALPVVLIGLLLCLGHLVMINQLMLVAAGGLLRSRRFRDVMIVALSLLGFSCYFVSRSLEYVARRFFVDAANLAEVRALNVLQWLPPGASARAIQQAAVGEWGEAWLWLAYAAVLLLGVVWLWHRLFLRMVTGGGFLVLGRASRSSGRPDEPFPSKASERKPWYGRLLRLFPYPLRMLCAHELRRSWRIPQRRIGLVQGLLSPFLFGGIFLFNRVDLAAGTFPQWISLLLPGYTIFSIWLIGMNMLGWEGRALSTLLSTPVPRATIFLGKSLGLLSLMAIPIAVLTLFLLLFTRSWWSLAGAGAALGAAAAVLGVLSVLSTLFPYPVNLESVQRQSSFSSGGCVTALANLVLTPASISLVCLPIAALYGLAVWREMAWLVAAGTPVVMVYGAVMLWLGTQWAGRLLLQREAEVVLATRLPEGG